MKPCNCNHTAFSRLDVLGLCVALSLVILVLFSCSKQTRERIYSTECAYNLKVIHATSDRYLQDNRNWVSELSTNQGGTKEFASDIKASWRHFSALFPDPPPWSMLLCPKDARYTNSTPTSTLQNSNISYFLSLNLDARNPQWILAGTRNISEQEETILPVSSNSQTRWHSRFGLHGSRGYLVFADGHFDLAPRTNVPTDSLHATNFIVLP